MPTEQEPALRRRGFSLIEVLVVVGLLAVLSTLVVMAIGHLQTASKRQQTQLTMQNLSAMFTEYDVNRRVPFGAGNLTTSLIPGLAPNLYLNCPMNVTSSGSDRLGPAVQYTRYLMGQMISSPNTAKSLGKLPSSALMTFVGSSQSASRGPWALGNTYNIYDSVSYNYVDPVTLASTTGVFVRSYLYTDPTGATNGVLQDGAQQSPPNYYYWMPTFTTLDASNNAIINTTLAQASPVLLDAWGNPIIFVMGGYLGSGAPLDSNHNAILNSGSLAAGENSVQVHSPDYHPFFASAGPDGDFSKGDDNMYSFEK